MRRSHRSDEGISTNDKRNLKSPAIELPKLERNRSHNFVLRRKRNNVVLKPASPALVAHARMRGGRNSALRTRDRDITR